MCLPTLLLPSFSQKTYNVQKICAITRCPYRTKKLYYRENELLIIYAQVIEQCIKENVTLYRKVTFIDASHQFIIATINKNLTVHNVNYYRIFVLMKIKLVALENHALQHFRNWRQYVILRYIAKYQTPKEYKLPHYRKYVLLVHFLNYSIICNSSQKKLNTIEQMFYSIRQ